MMPDQNARHSSDQARYTRENLTVPRMKKSKIRSLKRYEAAYHNKREFDEQDKLGVRLNNDWNPASGAFRRQGSCQRLLNPIGHDGCSHALA
jgi:hypothetical protein